MTLSLPGGRVLRLDRPIIMGIANVTPDSFSDGGRWLDADAAVAHGMTMASEGADVIDVGGESTRPGALPVSADEQIARVVPVIQRLRRALDDAGRRHVAISVDTTQSAVAAAALDGGAGIINDVSAGRGSADMLALAAGRGAAIVLMHMQGTPATMQQDPAYDDVVEEVAAFLAARAAAAIEAGVGRDQIVIDPGIGFGKTRQHNLTLLASLARFVASGYPVLLGTSRKRFMGAICTPPPPPLEVGGDAGKSSVASSETPAPEARGPAPAPRELVGATCATTALGVAAGVAMFRVHDVQPNRQAADIAWALGHGH